MTLEDRIKAAVRHGCLTYEVFERCDQCDREIAQLWSFIGPLQDQILALRELASACGPTSYLVQTIDDASGTVVIDRTRVIALVDLISILSIGKDEVQT